MATQTESRCCDLRAWVEASGQRAEQLVLVALVQDQSWAVREAAQPPITPQPGGGTRGCASPQTEGGVLALSPGPPLGSEKTRLEKQPV